MVYLSNTAEYLGLSSMYLKYESLFSDYIYFRWSLSSFQGCFSAISKQEYYSLNVVGPFGIASGAMQVSLAVAVFAWFKHVQTSLRVIICFLFFFCRCLSLS